MPGHGCATQIAGFGFASRWAMADRIILLREGRIVESDPH